ncbi:ABC transporter substrate-binding protein [Bradyrhizobium sp. STM 3562]|uniref:ABC transporter substrate-binding protein n=1 Tax=Bradyrhizobium sp. STM 3562 TaxID=578924 RepID=UPI00388F94C7
MKRRDFIIILGGTAGAWPLAALTQPHAVPVIGFLSGRAQEESAHLVEAYRSGLKEGDFVEGQNLTIEFRWALGDYSRLPALAADLVTRNVTVISAVGGDLSPLAAKAATATIPIIFNFGGDPVHAGLIASFNRPGGNATGISTSVNLMEPKRLGLLRELAPGVVLIGALINPKFPPAVRQAREIEDAARALRQPIIFAKASTDEELEAAFASLVRDRVGALLVGADPFFDIHRDRIVAFAAQRRLPTIYQFREFALAGGVMSYGQNFAEIYRQNGQYTVKVLKGAKPADLPVQQVEKLELVINLKAAKVQGITISADLLSLADEVIE